MQIYRNFEGLRSQDVFSIMHRMLDAESLTCSGIIRRDDYEWVIGEDALYRIASNINNFDINNFDIEVTTSIFREPIYKIFNIEVFVSEDKLNTIILRKKNERRNEMRDIDYIKKRIEYFAEERGLGWGVSYDKFTDSVRIGFWNSYKQRYDYAIDTREAACALESIFDDIDKKLVIHHWTGHLPTIKDVIYNGPATIVFWVDGSRTVVKCQEDDDYDPEKGLAMAIAKKALGNKGNYCNIFKKWLPEEDNEVEKVRSANVYVGLSLDDSNFTKKLSNIIGDTILK